MMLSLSLSCTPVPHNKVSAVALFDFCRKTNQRPDCVSAKLHQPVFSTSVVAPKFSCVGLSIAERDTLDVGALKEVCICLHTTLFFYISSNQKS